MTIELPKIYTQEDQDAKDIALWKGGNERDQLLLMLRAFSSNRNPLPSTDDYYKVQRDATDDFRRSDFSEAQQYVDTLAQLVEFYKDLAEKYLDTLNEYGLITDGYGDVTSYPFVLTEGGEEVIGRVEVLALEDHDLDGIWRGYVKPFLAVATERERELITDRFAEQIKQGDDSE